jgi:hypothetical protein
MLETALSAMTGFFGTESPIIAAGMITAIPLHYLTSKGIELNSFLTNFVETPRSGGHRPVEEWMKMVKSIAGLLIVNSAAVTIFILMASMARDLAQESYWEKNGDFSPLHLVIMAAFWGLYFAFMVCGMKKRARSLNSYGITNEKVIMTNLWFLFMMLIFSIVTFCPLYVSLFYSAYIFGDLFLEVLFWKKE